jgi:hypothetical protein
MSRAVLRLAADFCRYPGLLRPSFWQSSRFNGSLFLLSCRKAAATSTAVAAMLRAQRLARPAMAPAAGPMANHLAARTTRLRALPPLAVRMAPSRSLMRVAVLVCSSVRSAWAAASLAWASAAAIERHVPVHVIGIPPGVLHSRYCRQRARSLRASFQLCDTDPSSFGACVVSDTDESRTLMRGSL